MSRNISPRTAARNRDSPQFYNRVLARKKINETLTDLEIDLNKFVTHLLS